MLGFTAVFANHVLGEMSVANLKLTLREQFVVLMQDSLRSLYLLDSSKKCQPPKVLRLGGLLVAILRGGRVGKSVEPIYNG